MKNLIYKNMNDTDKEILLEYRDRLLQMTRSNTVRLGRKDVEILKPIYYRLTGIMPCVQCSNSMMQMVRTLSKYSEQIYAEKQVEVIEEEKVTEIIEEKTDVVKTVKKGRPKKH